MIKFWIWKHWHPHFADRPVRDINGNALSGIVMRRRVGAKIEYRQVKPEETVRDEWISSIRD